jgi:hypothetical protein
MFLVEVDAAPLLEADPGPDEPIVSSLAHPPTSIPNKAMTPNALTD